MIRFLTSAMVAAALAGCTAQYMDRGSEKMRGKPVSDLVAAWGPPTGEVELGGLRYYSWTGSTAAGIAANATCTAQAIVDDQDVIRELKWNASGVAGWGCDVLAIKLLD